MARDFELVNMSEMRARLGEILDAVAQTGQAYLVERKGIPLACLVPVEDFMPDVPKPRWVKEFAELHRTEERYTTTLSPKHEFVIRVPASADEPELMIEIALPHGYPSVPPIIRANPIDSHAPHRWPDGSLCVYGMMTRWNPGKHSLCSSIGMARSWLRAYRTWLQTRQWPSTLDDTRG